MDAILQARAEQLATEFANQHHTAEDLNGPMRLMMKTALERMLNSELDVHLGRKAMPVALPAATRRRRATSRPQPRPGPPSPIAATAIRGRRCKATWAS